MKQLKPISQSRDKNMRTIAQLLRDSKNLDTFYAKMTGLFKERYSMSKIAYFWKEQSKIVPRLDMIPETRTEPAAPKNGLKDAETYLVEILNELRIIKSVHEEQLALFKKLADTPKP